MKALSCILSALVAAGCEGSKITPIDLSPRCEIVAVRVEPESIALHVGDSVQFKATAVASSLCTSPTPSEWSLVVWSINDPSIARIDASAGLVRTVQTGQATIIAKSRQNPPVAGSGMLQVVP
jgi:hypothetical protein